MTSVLCPLPEVSSCSKQSPATKVCDSPELAVTRVQPDKPNAIIRAGEGCGYRPSPFSANLLRRRNYQRRASCERPRSRAAKDCDEIPPSYA
jgi:hypothetical protein